MRSRILHGRVLPMLVLPILLHSDVLLMGTWGTDEFERQPSASSTHLLTLDRARCIVQRMFRGCFPRRNMLSTHRSSKLYPNIHNDSQAHGATHLLLLADFSYVPAQRANRVPPVSPHVFCRREAWQHHIPLHLPTSLRRHRHACAPGGLIRCVWAESPLGVHSQETMQQKQAMEEFMSSSCSINDMPVG